MLTDKQIEAIPYKEPGNHDIYFTHTTPEIMKVTKVLQPTTYKQMLHAGVMDEFYPAEEFYWLTCDYTRAITTGDPVVEIDCNLFTNEEIEKILTTLATSIEVFDGYMGQFQQTSLANFEDSDYGHKIYVQQGKQMKDYQAKLNKVLADRKKEKLNSQLQPGNN